MREQEPVLQLELPVARPWLEWAGPLACCGLLFARLPSPNPEGGLEHVVLPQELAAGLGAAALLAWAWLRRLELPRGPFAACALTLVGLELLSLAFAPNPWAALRASGLWLSGLAFLVVGRALRASRPQPERSEPSAPPLLVVPALVAAFVLAEALGVVIGLSPSGQAPGGLLGQRNAAAELLVLCAPTVAYLAVRARPPGHRVAALAVGALLVMAVVMTRTRSAWLALALTGALGLFLSLRPSLDASARRRALPLLAAAALGLALAALLPTKLAWKSTRPYRQTLARLVEHESGSGAGRLVQYATTLKLAAAHPLLGVGPGNWAGQYPTMAEPQDPTVVAGLRPTNRLPSSDFLGFLAERGAIAFAALLVLGWALFREEGALRWPRRATLVALVVVGSLDAVLQSPGPLVAAAWLLGALSAPAATTEPLGSRRHAHLVAAALLLGLAVLGLRRVMGFSLTVSPRGLEDLERAARLDPGDVALRLQLAEAWTDHRDCQRARPHLDAALRYAPGSAAVRALAARCP